MRLQPQLLGFFHCTRKFFFHYSSHPPAAFLPRIMDHCQHRRVLFTKLPVVLPGRLFVFGFQKLVPSFWRVHELILKSWCTALRLTSLLSQVHPNHTIYNYLDSTVWPTWGFVAVLIFAYSPAPRIRWIGIVVYRQHLAFRLPWDGWRG